MSKICDENAATLSFPTPGNVAAGAKRNAFKNLSTPSTIKKKPLSGLNNLMHASTPIDKYSNAFRPSVTICNDAFRKHQQPQANSTKKTQIKTVSREEYDEEDEEENLFDYFDFGCTKNCNKSDREIWSEQCLLGDELINKLLAGDVHTDTDVENDSEEKYAFARNDDVEVTVLNAPENSDDVVPPALPSDFDDAGITSDPFFK